MSKCPCKCCECSCSERSGISTKQELEQKLALLALLYPRSHGLSKWLGALSALALGIVVLVLVKWGVGE